MNLLGKAFRTLRIWLGLADASESHLTPSHRWLPLAPALARRQRLDSDGRRGPRTPANDAR